MTSLRDKIINVIWRLLPTPVERKLRTEAGKRFSRFVLVAAVGVVTSQVVLGLLTGPVNMSAGASGVIASMTAAFVSYVLSRWAWERTGNPDLLRETLPFWIVSMAVWGILGLTSHFASVWAHAEGYTHIKKHIVVQGAYLLMNCVTFMARFLFFHYVLFANKDGAPARLDAPGPAGQSAAVARAVASSSGSAAGSRSATASAAISGEPGRGSRSAEADRPELASADAHRGSDTGPMALISGDSGPPRL